MSRFSVTLGLILTSAPLLSCGSSSKPPPGSNPVLFPFVVGDWTVTVTAESDTCDPPPATPPATPVTFTEEWQVSEYYVAMNVAVPIPTTAAADAGAAADAASGAGPRTITFSGVGIPVADAGPDQVQWSGSLEQDDIADAGADAGAGCLARTTSLLDVQFGRANDGQPQLDGTRSVVEEFAGGSDCPQSCRMVFHVHGRPHQ
jgi:hypothetical protein